MKHVIKYLSIAAVAVIGLMISSCADEGPHEIGKFDYDIKVLFTTPQSALVEITIPENTDDNLIEGLDQYDSYYPLFNADGIRLANSDYEVSVIEKRSVTSNDSEKVCLVKILYKNLMNNTTYYIGIRPYEKCWAAAPNGVVQNSINTKVSFTTTKEGDYSSIEEMKCEVLQHDQICTVLEIIPPVGFYMVAAYNGTKLFLSQTEDMSDPIESTWESVGNSGRLIFRVEGLKSGIYYLKLTGSIFLNREINGNSINYSNRINSEDSVILLPKPLDLSSVEEVQLSVKLKAQTEQFSLLELTLPQGYIVRGNNSISYLIQRNNAETISGTVEYFDVSSDLVYTFGIPQTLLKGDHIDLTISGYFAYSYGDSGSWNYIYGRSFKGSIDIETDVAENWISLELLHDEYGDYILPKVINSYKDVFSISWRWSPYIYIYENENDYYDSKNVIYGWGGDGFRVNGDINQMQKGHKYIVKMTDVEIRLTESNETVLLYTSGDPLVITWTYE